MIRAMPSPVAPVRTVRPSRQSAEQEQDEDDEQNETEAHDILPKGCVLQENFDRRRAVDPIPLNQGHSSSALGNRIEKLVVAGNNPMSSLGLHPLGDRFQEDHDGHSDRDR